MELTFAQQSTAFLFSIILGFAIGLLYSAFTAARVLFDFGKIAVIVSDIFFMLLSSVAVFYFLLAYLFGYVRIYVFFGVLSGFLIYRFSIGRLLTPFLGYIIGIIKSLIDKMCHFFKKIFKKLLKIIKGILYNKSGLEDDIQNNNMTLN